MPALHYSKQSRRVFPAMNLRIRRCCLQYNPGLCAPTTSFQGFTRIRARPVALSICAFCDC